MTNQIFTLEEKIRFEHVDAAGIVFYPHYFKMINRVVEDWFEQELECDYQEMHQIRHLGIPTVHMDISFKRPSRLGEQVLFELQVAEVGNSSFLLEHQLKHGDETRLHVLHRLVFASLDGISSTSIPADIRKNIGRFLKTNDST